MTSFSHPLNRCSKGKAGCPHVGISFSLQLCEANREVPVQKVQYPPLLPSPHSMADCPLWWCNYKGNALHKVVIGLVLAFWLFGFVSNWVGLGGGSAPASEQLALAQAESPVHTASVQLPLPFIPRPPSLCMFNWKWPVRNSICRTDLFTARVSKPPGGLTPHSSSWRIFKHLKHQILSCLSDSAPC